MYTETQTAGVFLAYKDGTYLPYGKFLLFYFLKFGTFIGLLLEFASILHYDTVGETVFFVQRPLRNTT